MATSPEPDGALPPDGHEIWKTVHAGGDTLASLVLISFPILQELAVNCRNGIPLLAAVPRGIFGGEPDKMTPHLVKHQQQHAGRRQDHQQVQP